VCFGLGVLLSLLLEINAEIRHAGRKIMFLYIFKFIINLLFYRQKFYRVFPVTMTHIITS